MRVTGTAGHGRPSSNAQLRHLLVRGDRVHRGRAPGAGPLVHRMALATMGRRTRAVRRRRNVSYPLERRDCTVDYEVVPDVGAVGPRGRQCAIDDEVEARGSGKANTKRVSPRWRRWNENAQRRAEVRQTRGGAALRGRLNTEAVTWLILPVVICLSQRLSHASVSTSTHVKRNCEWLIKSVVVHLIVPVTRITVAILELIHAKSADCFGGMRAFIRPKTDLLRQ